MQERRTHSTSAQRLRYRPQAEREPNRDRIEEVLEREYRRSKRETG